MGMEFGWWANNPETGKFQIRVNFHGGNIAWHRKQGHHSSWEIYGPPNEDDWERLLAEAARRVPRRLMSPKQYAALEHVREQAQ